MSGEDSRAAGGRLPAAVYWFGATSLANDFASEIIYPLLPAFVTQTLGGGALALGILDGVADAVAASFKLVSGYLSELRWTRGIMVVLGYGIATLVRPLIALASATWHVIALRAVDRVGKGIRTAPRDVMIADVTTDEIRGRAFGLHRAADHTGAILGPLAATLLLARGFAVRDVFWMAAVPGAAAVILAWVAVLAARRAGSGAGPVSTTPVERDKPAPGFAMLVAVLSLGTLLRAPETLLILRTQDLGVAVSAIPLLWAALHVVRSTSSYGGGTLADRWGPRRTMAVGWVLYAALALGFARATSMAQAIALFLAYGFVAALTESPERKLIAQLAGGAKRGRGFGWYHGTLSAVALPGAALFGWLYQAHGARVAFEVSAAATIAALALLAAAGNARTGEPA
jgi:MFS family permease